MRLFLSVVYLAMVTKTWLGFWNFFLRTIRRSESKIFHKVQPSNDKQEQEASLDYSHTSTSPAARPTTSLSPGSDSTRTRFPIVQRSLIHTFISVWTKLFPIGLEIVTYSNILSPRGRQRKQRTWGPKPYKAEVKTDVKLLWTSFYSQPPPSLLTGLLENPVWWGGAKLHRPWPTAEEPPRASVANIWKLQWTGRGSEVQARCDSTWLY